METFTLQLTAIAHGGAALGRYESRVIFVPYALPGETVRAEISEDKDRYAFAHLVEVRAARYKMAEQETIQTQAKRELPWHEHRHM